MTQGMSADSLIPGEIQQAYRESEYRVHAPQPFTLRIGLLSDELRQAQAAKRADCSAFITAFNPFSECLTDAANEERQAQLVKELHLRSLAFWEGVGQHPSNGWPGEPSLLVFGLNLEAAKELGRRYQQNAIVWSGDDGVPQLVLLR